MLQTALLFIAKIARLRLIHVGSVEAGFSGNLETLTLLVSTIPLTGNSLEPMLLYA
jgi:hypothetical protein